MTHEADFNKPQPEKLYEWTAHGFSIGAARRWINHGYPIAAAQQWCGVGVTSPEAANAWTQAGVLPSAVTPLLRAGMTPRDVTLWTEMGYSVTEAAERHKAGYQPQPRVWWKEIFGRSDSPTFALEAAEVTAMRAMLQAGVPATTARVFVDTGWDGETAIPWARAGINVIQAAIFQELGLTPTEAVRLISAGHDGLEIVRTWWDSQIPRTEVAAWLGAGFSLEEAKQARSTGISAEQVAVLRALGD